MKFIYVGAFRFPTYDAAAARVLNIGRTMRNLGHEVTFIAWGGKYSDNASENVDFYDGFKYYISGELNEKSLFHKIKDKFHPGAKSIELLKQNISTVDIVISYNPSYSFNRRLIRICRRNNVKYVADITEWYDNNELKFIDYIPNWLNMTRTNRKSVKNMILISTYLDKYYSKNHNIVIPATCNSDDVKWTVIRPLKRESEPVSLIYAGNPAKKDKLHEIINAVERVEKLMPGKIKLMVLGIDKFTYISIYKNLLVNANLSNAVQFVGRVNQDEVPKFYARADFMVLLRDSTRKSNAGFPTKFAESMVSGTPVIANITSDIGKYLKDGYNGYAVAAPTSESLYDVLCSKIVHINRNKVAEMRDNAKQTGLKAFDYSVYTTSMNDFLNHLQ